MKIIKDNNINNKFNNIINIYHKMNNNEIKFKINQNYYSDIDQINNRLFVGKNTAEIAKVYIDIQ
jgi:hypothetical protein